MADLCTGGFAFASYGNFGGGTSVVEAFDNNFITSKWAVSTLSAPYYMWCTVQPSGGAVTIVSYTVTSGDFSSGGMPRNWVLEGSNDGFTTWTVLDIQEGQTWSGNHVTNTYNFSNSTPYAYYRFYFTACVRDNAAGVTPDPFVIGEIGLWTGASATGTNKGLSATAYGRSAALSGRDIGQTFDNSIGADNGWAIVADADFNASGYGNWWMIGYRLTSAAAINQYTITSNDNDHTADPQDWKLQSSNDSHTWVDADTRTGETFSSFLQTKTYNFTNTTGANKWWRLVITKRGDNGTTGGMAIEEIEMDAVVTAPTGTLAFTEPTDTAAFAGDVPLLLPDAPLLVGRGRLLRRPWLRRLPLLPDLPALDITGTWASTEAADTAAFNGDVVIAAALATTEAADTAVFNGTVTDPAITGTFATTEATDTAAFNGTVAWTGTLATTEAQDVAAFNGQVVISAALATTEAADTAAFAGNVTWTGTLATTEAADTALFNGSAAWTGTLATTEAADTALFNGGVAWTGTLATTEAADFFGAVSTFNPSDKSAQIVLSNGNLTATESGGGPGGGVRSTIGVAGGKHYFEFTTNANFTGSASCVGIATGSANVDTVLVSGTGGSKADAFNGNVYFNGSFTGATVGAALTSCVVGVALDMVNSRIWYRKDGGNWLNSGTNDPASNVGGVNIATLFPTNAAFAYLGSDQNTAAATINFGLTAFAFTPPVGFTASWTTGWTGQVIIAASLATTEGQDTANFNGQIGAGLFGTLATTEATDTALFNGQVVIAATLATTEAADVAAFNGQVVIAAALATTEAQDTAAFNGTLGALAVTGTLAFTELQDVANFNGRAGWTGTLATTEAKDIAAFNGYVTDRAAVLAAVEAADIALFSGSVTGFVEIPPGKLNFGWANVIVRRRL